MRYFFYILVKLGVNIFRYIPFGMLYAGSTIFAFLLEHIIRYRRKVITKNLRNAFSEKEIPQIRHGFYQHLADVFLESIKGYTLPEEALLKRFELHNLDLLHRYHQEGRSVIFTGGHFCNWEWGALAFSIAFPQPCITVYKPISNKKINDFIQKKRAVYHAQPVAMRSVGRALVQAKKQPAAFLLLADQGPSDMKNAIWIHFLGRDTPFLHGPEKIARATGFPVIYGSPRKLKRGHYSLTFKVLHENPKNTAPDEITAAFAQALEEDIRAMPSLWLWSHRRWKRAGMRHK